MVISCRRMGCDRAGVGGSTLLTGRSMRPESRLLYTLAAREQRCRTMRVESQPLSNGAKSSPVNGEKEETSDRIHRLHQSSAALRELLQKRAERQRDLLNGNAVDSQGTLVKPVDRPSIPAMSAEIVGAKKMAKVTFWLKFHVEYGQHVCLVGGSPELGDWILSDSIDLQWSEGDMWHATLELPANSVVEYKYVVVGHGGHAVAWQSGNNSVLALAEGDEEVEVHDNWGGNPGAKVVTGGNLPVTREKKLLSWATELESQVIQQRQELRRVRMELLAAQEEARFAREEAKSLRQALQKSEEDRMNSAKTVRDAEAVNTVLKDQIKDTTASFRQALEIAAMLLNEKKSASTTSATKASTKKNAN